MDGFVYLAQDKHGAPLIWSTIHPTAQEAVNQAGHFLPDMGWTLHRVTPVPADDVPEQVIDYENDED